jgi:hypothetical protein
MDRAESDHDRQCCRLSERFDAARQELQEHESQNESCAKGEQDLLQALGPLFAKSDERPSEKLRRGGCKSKDQSSNHGFLPV